MKEQMTLFDDVGPGGVFTISCARELQVHPLLERVPEMPEGLYRDLKEDISGLGVINPIILVDGKILDGRARWRACQELGIDCPGRILSGCSPHDVVLSLNLFRGHYTESEQKMARERLQMPY